MPPLAKGERALHQPVPADGIPDHIGSDHIESDLMDLTSVRVADLRHLQTSPAGPRLLAELRRARHNAMGGGTEPGRAE
ncbi:aldo/keto reductase [Streptomyces halstedii]|uniref:Aldo/keto reductase n=1 Tax=Streptomyces halstedii TaxID=1944 RepID=A0A6N9UH60_STRHA|nr:aldo/keto reductase [Streptomyces halstedii]NEA20295.1 aldo/keto reductase [Streptomyces halstedii]